MLNDARSDLAASLSLTQVESRCDDQGISDGELMGEPRPGPAHPPDGPPC